MGIEELRVSVEQPFDWIGAVLVPCAAILVSSAIAVGLATLERRARKRDRQQELLGQLVQLLNVIGSSDTDKKTDEQVNLLVTEFFSVANVLEMMLKRRDWPLPDFLCFVLATAHQVGRKELVHVAPWLMHVVKAWRDGTVSSDGLAKQIPMDARVFHPERVDPSEWEYRVKHAKAPEPKTPPGFYRSRG